MKLISIPIKTTLFLFTTALAVTFAITSGGSTRSESFEGDPQQVRSPERAPTPVFATPGTQASHDVPEEVFVQITKEIRMLRSVGNLDELLRVGKRIQNDWGALGAENYGSLCREYLAAITSGPISSQDVGILNQSQEYAVIALRRADYFDLGTEWQLLAFFRYPVRKGNLDERGMEERRERVKLWLHAINRLEIEKDVKFDPNQRLESRVEPPQDSNIIAGMPAESIKDPKLRAEYQKAIDENNKKLEHFNEQYRLRQTEPLVIQGGVKYISRMYAQTPVNLQEFRILLNQYSISSDVREQIETEIKLLRRSSDFLLP